MVNNIVKKYNITCILTLKHSGCRIFPPGQGLSSCHLIVTPTSILSPTSLNRWPPLIVLSYYNLVISRRLYKWNYIVYICWDWLFSLSLILWIFIQVLLASIVYYFLLLSNIPWNECIVVCLTCEGHLNFLQVLAIMTKLLQTFVYRFFYECKSLCFGIKVQKYNCSVLW